MGLFQRIRDNLAKGYNSATDKPSPSVAELHAFRDSAEKRNSTDSSLRTRDDQIDARQELSEIDSMIARAQHALDKSAATKVAEAMPAK